ncbi:uncharacterized protein BT62DRAFT_1073925 [Guyanagaster necrorhizus]|uniref:Fruit-body specific protein a n=1 Tax=Guyanagaster necrorhizus TaxID=856835 RepID=A0A9P8AX12_9AGAR|nr:uncharacterized protein BT62DRAFT_1073925 [Guyanagaster necrorhizus MCA 3950]KAG7449452.1 hypothetical protein BT62DRAFT_1073925 [Guyanagaster necrorhizus MCA 3950]
MRFFSALLVTVATALVVRGAATLNATEAAISSSLSVSLNKGNNYGAPIPPWKSGCSPGWYYGDHPDYLQISLPLLKDSLICWLLDLLQLGFLCPQPPYHQSPPSNNDGYKLVFYNYSGAVEGDDYLTYGLVDTVGECMDMCDSVDGCNFINPYHDVNGKNGSPLLTCSLFSKCHGIEDAINYGGQTQPDGSIDYITDSAGYCKD